MFGVRGSEKLLGAAARQFLGDVPQEGFVVVRCRELGVVDVQTQHQADRFFDSRPCMPGVFQASIFDSPWVLDAGVFDLEEPPVARPRDHRPVEAFRHVEILCISRHHPESLAYRSGLRKSQNVLHVLPEMFLPLSPLPISRGIKGEDGGLLTYRGENGFVQRGEYLSPLLHSALGPNEQSPHRTHGQQQQCAARRRSKRRRMHQREHWIEPREIQPRA